MSTFLIELIGISLPMTGVILLLLAFSGAIKSKFSASCRFVIWLVVIIRLAIPFGGVFLPSLIEIPLYEEAFTEPVGDIEKNEPSASFPITEEDRSEIIQDPSLPVTDGSPVAPDTPVQVVPDTGIITENDPAAENNPKEGKPSLLDPKTIVTALFLLWALGAASFFITDIIRYNVFASKIKKTLRPAKDTSLFVYKQLCSEMNIKREPALYVSSLSQSPILCGYFKKRIIIPDIPLSEESLRSVLAHELVHHRRGDLWTKLLARFANALHWFNPLAHLAASRLNREMELSCDEKVLRTLSEEERVLYSKTMLDIIKNCRGTDAVLTTKFNPKKKAVSERIKNILDTKKKKRGIIIICIVAALCLIAGIIIGVKLIADDNTTDDNDDGFTVSLYTASDSYKIYGKDGIKYGQKGPLKLIINDKKEILFEGIYCDGGYSSCKSDYTGDGTEDHCISSRFISDKEKSNKFELYVFDGKTLEVLEYTAPKDISVEENVNLYSDSEYYYVQIGKQAIRFLRSDLAQKADELLDTPVAKLIGFDLYADNPVLEYDISVTKDSNYLNGEQLIGSLTVPYRYDGEKLVPQLDNISFKEAVSPGATLNEYSKVLSEGESFTLYATKASALSGGENEPLMLFANGQQMFFTGNYISIVSSETEYFYVDITNDTVKDHVIILPTANGTGIKKEEIHAFNGESLEKIAIEDPLEYISSMYSFSSDKENYLITQLSADYVSKIPKALFLTYNTEYQLDTPILDCGWYDYGVIKNTSGEYQITAVCPVSAAKDNREFLQEYTVYLTYRQRKLVCERNDCFNYSAFYSDRDDWRIRAYNDTIILAGNGKRYVYKDYGNDPAFSDLHIPDIETGTNQDYARVDFLLFSDSCALIYSKKRTSNEEYRSNKIAIIDTETGRVIDFYEVSDEEILAINGLSPDILKPYTYESTGTDTEYSIYISVNSDNNLDEFRLSVTLVSSDNRIRISNSAALNLTFWKMSLSDGRYHINSPAPIVTSVENIDEFKYCDEDIKNLAVAFLTNDTDTMEEIMRYPKGIFEHYKDLKFGKYTITDNSYGDILYVDVEILESSLDTIPPGRYNLEVSYSMAGPAIEGLSDRSKTTTGKGAEFVSRWTASTALLSFDCVNATENIPKNHGTVVYFLGSFCNLYENTPEKYKEAAKRIFGMEDIDVSYYLQENGMVSPAYHGGISYFYRFVSETEEDGIITVRIQGYADYMYTIESDVYEYKFKDMGDYLQVISSTLISKGEYPIRGIGA